ncbi:EAL and HDOD domain-containing protein [Desulfovibrio gilichinskyi]|uniref:EAL and modified HD-GYP domain-containing signal transduction protein n=1 Tax=Desulfovibrio gilichinskyi TaxID=1519643 RepID=A0A1X7CXJ3_9BACT|nr:HDOD domain-containing protein [Desulfovibrio gilichinskyi]SMF04979.1 EAL and modified HD-GYP domain-containing signal transduction protein [Desulfovibrio gilichinskyi]
MSDSELFLDSFFVARQPVFTRERAVWGYELLFRNSEFSAIAEVGDADAATSQVIADGFGLIQEDISKGQRLLVNFPYNMLLENAADLLPPEICVVEILETVDPDPEVLDALSLLKKQGYTIALDDYIGQEGFEPFVEIADIIKVDCLELSVEELKKLVADLKKYRKTLLAEKVEDTEMFDLCMNLGFNLFQGFFFSRPEIVPGKKMSSNNLNRMQLLRSISGPEFNVDDLSKAINSDVSISYRLLRFMNSPYFGLPHVVSSIQQAVVLIGYKKLASWLRVILLSDMCSAAASSELAFLSIKRAKFLELLSLELEGPKMSSDSMFLLGLFSLLDVLLGKPMKSLLAELPIEKELMAALCGESSVASVWLDLVVAFEKAKWESVGSIIFSQKLSPASVARNHLAAMQWANEITLLSKH